jgi:predicted small secreted protein
MKTLLIRLIVLAGLLSLGACNTMDGVGRDMEDAGDSIQDAAK